MPKGRGENRLESQKPAVQIEVEIGWMESSGGGVLSISKVTQPHRSSVNVKVRRFGVWLWLWAASAIAN